MRGLLPFAALLWLGLAGAAAGPLPAKLMPGDMAPLFVRNDLNGRPVDLKALRGKLVLIDFWASWCAPCIVEIPQLIDLQKRYGGRGLQVIGISMDDAAAPVKETAAHYPFNYPVLLGDAKFGMLYGGILGLPVQMLVGPDGKLSAVWRGDVAASELEKAVGATLSRQHRP